ncbi:MAG TPA: 30S ribosomal protein S7 [Patescibacteria group bacterium]|nr:30S ribosomal protein S7 [Patescibacteria group bacterium]
MRGKPAPKRKIYPDPRFQSTLVAKFINYLMRAGKKSLAQSIVYNSFDIIQKKTKKEPLGIFDLALKNVTPAVEVRSRRIGGGNYQIPYPVKAERRNALAFRWIIDAAKTQKGRPMQEKLANELIAASQKQGEAIRKKQDVHRMAEANRAFAHFAR